MNLIFHHREKKLNAIWYIWIGVLGYKIIVNHSKHCDIQTVSWNITVMWMTCKYKNNVHLVTFISNFDKQ